MDVQRRNSGETVGENSLIDISSSDAVPSETPLFSVGVVFLPAFEDERSLFCSCCFVPEEQLCLILDERLNAIVASTYTNTTVRRAPTLTLSAASRHYN